jgi:hypothetical protein
MAACSVVGLLAVSVLGGCRSTSAKGVAYGEQMSLSARKTVDVARVIENPTKYEGKRIRVAGVIDTVCAHKGCWINMTQPGGGEALFVKFTCPVEGRLIPLDAVGKEVVVEGELEIKMIPEDEARHYAEDAGKSKEEIAKIVGPQKTLKLNSPAAEVRGS